MTRLVGNHPVTLQISAPLLARTTAVDRHLSAQPEKSAIDAVIRLCPW